MTPVHSRRHYSEPDLRFICPECGIREASQYYLRLHLASHEEFTIKNIATDKLTKMSCGYCSYTGRNDLDIESHTASHMSEPRFRCVYCPHASFDRHSILSHCSVVHTGRRPNVFDKAKRVDLDGMQPMLVNLSPRVKLRRVIVDQKIIPRAFKRIKIIDSGSESEIEDSVAQKNGGGERSREKNDIEDIVKHDIAQKDHAEPTNDGNDNFDQMLTVEHDYEEGKSENSAETLNTCEKGSENVALNEPLSSVPVDEESKTETDYVGEVKDCGDINEHDNTNECKGEKEAEQLATNKSHTSNKELLTEEKNKKVLNGQLQNYPTQTNKTQEIVTCIVEQNSVDNVSLDNKMDTKIQNDSVDTEAQNIIRKDNNKDSVEEPLPEDILPSENDECEDDMSNMEVVDEVTESFENSHTLEDKAGSREESVVETENQAQIEHVSEDASRETEETGKKVSKSSIPESNNHLEKRNDESEKEVNLTESEPESLRNTNTSAVERSDSVPESMESEPGSYEDPDIDRILGDINQTLLDAKRAVQASPVDTGEPMETDA